MLIGILPCAGTATRIHGIPKYLLPIPDGYFLQWHIRQMHKVCQLIMIGSNDKNFDSLKEHEDYFEATPSSVYLAANRRTMTETVLSARRSHNLDADILLTMPDTYWNDADVHTKLITTLRKGADVAVAVFKARPGQHRQGGMCRMGDAWRVTEVIDKPKETDLEWIWGALAWRPAFWDCMRPDDPHVGYALPRAIAAGLNVYGVMSIGGFWDCGTPERYFELIAHLQREAI